MKITIFKKVKGYSDGCYTLVSILFGLINIYTKNMPTVVITGDIVCTGEAKIKGNVLDFKKPAIVASGDVNLEIKGNLYATKKMYAVKNGLWSDEKIWDKRI